MNEKKLKELTQAIKNNKVNVEIWGNILMTEFSYPRVEKDKIQKIQIGLEDVRAADSIEVEFDFERDGYIIRMDKTKNFDSMAEVIKEKEEVAFIPAWNE